MFGTLRLILALFVVAGHVLEAFPEVHRQFSVIIDPSDESFIGHFLGCFAVVGFFMISGFVMTKLVAKYYSRFGKPTLYFYLDRFLRIYPQFLFFFLLSYIVDLIFHFDFFILRGGPSWTNFFLGLLVVPLNYHHVIPYLDSYIILPPAWSLGLEEQFYWLFPLLLLIPRAIPWLALASFAFFTFVSGFYFVFPNEGYFISRFLPGLLFPFLIGKMLADTEGSRNNRDFLVCIAIWYLCLGSALIPKPATYFRTVALATTWSVVVLGPLIFKIGAWPRRNWDDLLGSCSYGVFLSHYLIIMLLLRFHQTPKNFAVAFFLVAFLAMCAGFFGYFFLERPFHNWKIRVREAAGATAPS